MLEVREGLLCHIRNRPCALASFTHHLQACASQGISGSPEQASSAQSTAACARIQASPDIR